MAGNDDDDVACKNDDDVAGKNDDDVGGEDNDKYDRNYVTLQVSLRQKTMMTMTAPMIS